MTINERIRDLRRDGLGLTLEEFGARVGVSRAAMSNIETGARSVTDQMFVSICREFSVRPEWLRDGSGEMFYDLTPDDEIMAFVGRVMKDDSAAFQHGVLTFLSSLEPEQWKALESMVDYIDDLRKKEKRPE